MNQVVNDKMLREIMVIKNSILFGDILRVSGFIPLDNNEFQTMLLKNYEYMQRGIAETNFEYKQPIPYGVVRNLHDNTLFVYKRGGKGSNAGDSRLHSKISVGVGGHIEKIDGVSSNIMIDALLREIEEELKIQKQSVVNITLIGGINDDSNEVGKVHFGMCYLVDIDTKQFALEDGELESGSFVSMQSLEQMIDSGEYDVETWTQILCSPLKNYIQ